MTGRRTTLFVLVALASAVVVAQDRSRPAFKAGVQLVRIDVSVIDGARQPVRGLQASDFTVLEDGQPRPVRALQFVDQQAPPSAATAMGAVPSTDVATNRGGDDTSRLIVILMDRSIPPERPMIAARQIADAAVDAMAPGDLAAIVTTGGGIPQNFTSDRARLHQTIASSDWSQQLSRAQKDDPIIAMLGLADRMTDGACLCGLCVMDTIARVANDLRDVPRRKVLLFVGSNIVVQAGPRAMNADIGCDKRVRDSRERLFDALGSSGLTVHAIDPQGLSTIGPETRASVPNGTENRDGAALRGQLTQERSEFMAAQGNLEVLPALTGGRAVLNSNEPSRMVPAVLHESDAYYLLAFEPAAASGDGRHTIDVKVARRGVAVHTVRSREDADAGPASASPLDRALTALLPDASVPLEMSVAAFAGPDSHHAYARITLDASSFAAGAGPLPLEIAVAATDERGRPIATARQTQTVQVPATGGTAPSIELQTYLTLPPGAYELRAAVMNAGTRAVASVFTHLTVPSFADRLALSDIVLGTRDDPRTEAGAPPALPIFPTNARVLSADASAWAFVRVYRDSETKADPVGLDMSLLDSSGKQVSHQVLDETAFDGREADVRLGLPLKRLPAGRYVLRIEARRGHDAASKTLSFTVQTAQPSFTQEHSPELDAALAAAAGYIEQYERRISAISAEELYEQAVQTAGSTITGEIPARRGAANRESAPAAGATRRTRGNVMTISLGAQGWVSFRDVFEIDGRPVRDREERLSRILQHVTPDSLEQARQIAAESARYNLDGDGVRIDRTINVPMTALFYLRRDNQPRSSFRFGKPERIGGVPCVALQFVEQGRPRLIRTADEAPAHGTFWIDMTHGGRVLKTELRMESGVAGHSVRSRTDVTYAPVEKLALWVPMIMDEAYDVGRQTVTGHAVYSEFREFAVTTSEGIK